MKRRGFILIGLLAAAGCSTRGPHVRVAAPMQAETVGLHLIAEPRRGPESAPYTVLCNVALHFVNNTRLALEANGKIVFYAEREGYFYPLRELQPDGVGTAPYSMSGKSVTLPRPPKPGAYRIFAVQYPSDARADDTQRLWRRNLVSNSIFVEFAELNESDQKAADSVTQGLVDAKQHRPDFRKGTRRDPTQRRTGP